MNSPKVDYDSSVSNSEKGIRKGLPLKETQERWEEAMADGRSFTTAKETGKALKKGESTLRQIPD